MNPYVPNIVSPFQGIQTAFPQTGQMIGASLPNVSLTTPSATSSNEDTSWRHIVPFLTTTIGSYFYNTNSPTRGRDAVMNGAFAGLGTMMYRYLFAPAVNTFPNAVYTSNPTGAYRQVVRPVDEEEFDDAK